MSYFVKSRYEWYKETQGQLFELPSMTQQHFKDECDINNIIARYEATGLLTDPLQSSGRMYEFGDYSSVKDYQDSLNTIIEARAMFDDLPARVRERFNYDPSQLLFFLADETNRDEAVRLGLVSSPSPTATEPVGSPAEPAEA